MKQSHSDAGFTLLELLVAVAIMATVAVLALPYARSGGGEAGLRTFAQTLVASLRLARATAIQTASDIDFAIDASTGSFTIGAYAKPQPIPQDLTLHIVSAEQPTQDATEARVTFFTDGTSSGARIHISSRIGGERYIVVDWATGAARIEGHKNAAR